MAATAAVPMLPRLFVALAALLAVASCGDLETRVSPPLPTHPSPAVPVFQPGSYFFGISPGAWVIWSPDLGQSVTGNLCLCIGRCPSTVRVPVVVEGAGAGFIVRAVHGDLRVRLSVNGAAAGGTLTGSAADGGTTSASRLWVEGSEASLGGRVVGAHAMSGTVAGGQVSIGDSHGSGGCGAANWFLSER